MNKKTIITMMLALVAMAGLAQEIKMNETAISDYIPLFNAKDYQAYSFDVSAIKDLWSLALARTSQLFDG